MKESNEIQFMEAYGFAYEKTYNTVLGALARSDEPGREIIIQDQRKRISFYQERKDPESQGKADAIRDALKRFKG